MKPVRSRRTRAALGTWLLLACDAGQAPGAPCPQRMAHLPEVGACIDRYEARIVDGRAEPARGVVPERDVDHATATRACRAAGLRLCTEREWTRACVGPGPEPRRMPHDDGITDTRPCNTATAHDDLSRAAPRPGGAMTRCVTPEGVFDLSGNVWEWTDGRDDSGTLRELRGGGFANGGSAIECVPEDRFYQPPDARFDGYGFRCCADARF
ncbi:MAG: formylglycine-generating enzyme family protein [Myxococcota bacterium]|nr:formylglycine-generating enzyme family protein [Myxococcota bacterium]MDW8362435.1 SUMF1/EgtB/PvdO family nonheme iron enzyme [Myxococcales bacterium]